MKMDQFAAKVSAIALCAAALALATPAHAQRVYQYSTITNLEDDSNPDNGNANHSVVANPGFLAVTGGGHSDATNAAQASGHYSMTETQMYDWQDTGSPVPATFYGEETDTFNTTASAVPGEVQSTYDAGASAGRNGQGYTSGAGVSSGGQSQHPSDSYGPVTYSISGVTSGISPEMYPVTLSASAGGFCQPGGSAFASQGKAQTSFQ